MLRQFYNVVPKNNMFLLIMPCLHPTVIIDDNCRRPRNKIRRKCQRAMIIIYDLGW